MSVDLAQRALAVSAAAAADINDELTIIMNCCAELQDFVASDEIKDAAQRIAWKTRGLLNYADRRGVRRVIGPMERHIIEQ